MCVCRADDTLTSAAVTVPGLMIMAMTTRTNFVLAASMATACECELSECVV